MKSIYIRLMLACALGLGCMLAAPEARAQSAAEATASEVADEAPAAARTADGAESLSWQQILYHGRWPMKVIIAMSIVGLAFVLYLTAMLRAGQVVPGKLRDVVLEKIREGDLNEAGEMCSRRSSPFSAVTLAGIRYVQSSKRVDPGLVKDVMEGEGSRQAASIQGPTHYLLDIAAITPMIGLLGTVMGMFHAFKGVAAELAQARPVMLAEGVSMALITTAAGLIVGIPAMMFYAYFRGVAGKLVARLETASAEVLTAVLASESERELS